MTVSKRTLSLALALAIVACALPTIALAASTPAAYVGPEGYLYLSDGVTRLNVKDVSYLVCALDGWQYYVYVDEDGETALFRAGALPEAVGERLTASVFGEAVWLPSDAEIYYLDGSNTSLLMAYSPADGATRQVMDLQFDGCALSESMDGLRIVKQVKKGLYLNLNYSKASGRLTGAQPDAEALIYRDFGMFETEYLEGVGLELRLIGSETWLPVVDALPAAQASGEGLLYYAVASEGALNVYSYDPFTLSSAPLAALEGEFTGQMSLIEGYLYLMKTDGDVYCVSTLSGNSLIAYAAEVPLTSPSFAIADSLMAIYEDGKFIDTFQAIGITPSAAPARQTATPRATPTPEPTPVPYEKLQNGSRGEAVTALQQRLAALGYPSGKADGIFGNNTARSIMLLQGALGLAETGVADIDLQVKLFSANAPAYEEYVDLARGGKGLRVSDLQARLRALGYLAYPADGQYGARTYDAVALFQETAGMRVTGVASVTTQQALFKSGAPECEVYIALYPGDTGARVSEMQNRLIKLGYLGYASGEYDSASERAVKLYQQTARLSQTDGKASTATLQSMFSQDAPPCDEYPFLTYGDTGEFVRRMQVRLRELGYFSNEATGNFYGLTQDAVRAFQYAADLPPTGDADATTQKTLYSIYAPTAAPTIAPVTPAPTPYITPTPGGDVVPTRVVALLMDTLNEHLMDGQIAYTRVLAIDWLFVSLQKLGFISYYELSTGYYDQVIMDAVSFFQQTYIDMPYGAVYGEITEDTVTTLLGLV